MMRSLPALLVKMALACALLCGAQAPAHAHKPSDSYLTLNVNGAQIDGQWDIALRDLDFAIGLDQDGDGRLTWGEIRGRHQAIAAYAAQRLNLATAQGPCPLVIGTQLIDNHTDGAYSVLRLSAVCPAPVTTLEIGYRLFADLDPQHKGLLKISHAGTTATAIFDPQHAQQGIAVAAPDQLAQFGAYLRHGVWHIWIGFDHILFLLSLLLPAVLASARAAPPTSMRASFIDVLKVVTAFTLAHSITLTLASLSVIALPSRWVESAIAASVLAAALNNIFPLFRGRRPLAAFAFGLLHGFGFASVLTDLGLPQAALAWSLAGFNVGVEIGQLCIVAVFLPLAYLLRRTWFYRMLLTWGSGAIALLALLWLIERMFDLKLIA